MRRGKRAVQISATVTLLLIPSQAAWGVDFHGMAEGKTLKVNAERLQDDRQAEAYRARGVAAGPVAITTLVIACQGNGPGANTQTSMFCDGSRLGCTATPDPDDILYWLWPGIRATDGTITHGTAPTGTTCQGPDQATATIPAMTQADFQRLPLPPGTPTIQPGGGHVLITITGQAQATSPPTPISALTGRNHLVADNPKP